MSVKIESSRLKKLTANVIKGASCNRMLPLTALVHIKVENDSIRMTTTDMNNYIRCVGVCEGSNLEVVVDVETFSKLIFKLTTDTVELDTDGKSLIVKSNGTYRLELPVDESGKAISYPDPFETFEVDKEFTIKESQYTTVYKSNSKALSVSLAEPCYTGYYIGNRIITTDSYKICCNDFAFTDTPILVNADAMKLVANCKGDVELAINKEVKAIMVSDNEGTLIYSRLMTNLANYKIDVINQLIDAQLPSAVTFNRDSLLQTLDRISIFVSPFDKNTIEINFKETGAEIHSLKSNGSEFIKYAEVTNVVEQTICIDVVTLQQQISAQSGQFVTMYFGIPTSIKMTDGNTTQLIALCV